MFACRWDEGLDEAQHAVATHGDGPLVVLAGAGTGKTRALVARLACLLSQGTPAERILLLTFSRRAADDMLSRAATLVGLPRGRRPRGGTFHSVAHRVIAAHAEALGLPPGFGVLDPAEAADLVDLLRRDHGLDRTAVRVPRTATLVELCSRCVNTDRPVREVVATAYPWCEPHTDAIAALLSAYTARKRAAGLLDFDDLLLYWRALLGHADIGPALTDRLDHVLVDEYQDVNGLQRDIVQLLAPAGRGLTVVGDEAQAIYAFRGADPRHLRELVSGMPGAAVVRLERNFRSRQGVLDVANAVRPVGAGALRLHADRGAGPRARLVRCHDAPTEARAIVDRVLDAHQRGLALRDQAVLVRAAHHADLVEMELAARNVPYRKYGGLRFSEAAHVKDFVAAARLLDNPHDELAWYRVLRLHRAIGPARAAALVDAARTADGDALERWPDLVAAAPAAARAALATSFDGLARARAVTGPGLRAEAVLAAVAPLVAERYPDAPARLGDLERLVAAAATAENLSVWLAELTLDPPASTGDLAGPPHLDEDWVVVSTIHSAKGLEWSVVHVPHVTDGAIPIDMALGTPDGLEEERRLFYVAVTRARDELHLYAPLRLPHHRRAGDDRHSYAPVSRFVDDAVAAVCTVEEEVPPRPAMPAVGGVGTRRTGVVVDLDGLWR